MKLCFLAIILISVLACKTAPSDTLIIHEMDTEKARSIMKDKGYRETILEWAPPKGSYYIMWELKQGILIALNTERKIKELTLYLSTGGPKRDRKNFQYGVVSFNCKNDHLVLDITKTSKNP